MKAAAKPIHQAPTHRGSEASISSLRKYQGKQRLFMFTRIMLIYNSTVHYVSVLYVDEIIMQQEPHYLHFIKSELCVQCNLL